MNLATYRRTESAVYDVAQTHLPEFETQPANLYPEDGDRR